jgi:dihydroorotate dehydrogenase electron transfer subunit
MALMPTILLCCRHADLIAARRAIILLRMTPSRGQFVGTVLAQTPLCDDHFRLTLAIPNFPASVPGQFIQLDCDDEAGHSSSTANVDEIELTGPGSGTALLHDQNLLAPRAYLRRPFSIARHEIFSDHAEIDIIYRVVGKATHALQRLQPGTPISVIGPLGRGFAIPQDVSTICLVGGGVGVPPMFYLARWLTNQSGRGPTPDVVAFVGAQRIGLLPLPLQPSDLPLLSDGKPARISGPFGDCGIPTAITTDDGSCGQRGFITAALAAYLDQLAPATRAARLVCCCGPTPMMAATARVAAAVGVRCLVSLEQPMACGMGTCQSCVVQFQPPGAADWSYRLTCTDGPVFDAAAIRW